MRYGPRSVTNPYQLSSRQLRPLAPTYIVRVIVQNFVYRTNIVGASRDQSRVLYIYIGLHWVAGVAGTTGLQDLVGWLVG